MTAERNDNRMIENAALALVIYCDEHGLTFDAGVELAELVADGQAAAVEGRAIYLPKGDE